MHYNKPCLVSPCQLQKSFRILIGGRRVIGWGGCHVELHWNVGQVGHHMPSFSISLVYIIMAIH